jgi:MFS transporter, DHA2 family, methylenomycin A resistance protein
VGVLVALRAVLGAAAAAAVPASMAMIGRLYPDQAERSRALAAWAAISGSAVAAGPIAGGALVGLAGWRAVFLVNIPVAVLVLALTAGTTVRCPRGDRRIDWMAQLVACAVLALSTDAMIAAGARSWTHAAASGAVAVVLTAVFVLLERRSAAPVLEPVLLRAHAVRPGLAAGAAVNFTLAGGLFVLPLLLQQQRQLAPIAVGWAFLPLTLPFALNPPVTGRLVARLGARPPVLLGMALLTAGTALLGWACASGAGYGVLALGLLLTGFGMSFALPALVTAVVNAAPDGTAAAAGGLLNAVRQAGATLGVAAMGSFVGAGAGGGTPAGVTPDAVALAFALSALVCATAGAWFARATRRT